MNSMKVGREVVHADVVEALTWRARTQPDATALTFLLEGEAGEERLTYGRLDARARAIAARLQAVARPGDRALLLYPPGLDFVTALFGCMYAGVLAVPVAPPDPARLGPSAPRLRAVASDATPALVLTTERALGLAPGLSDAVPELREVRWLASNLCPDEEGAGWKRPELGPDTRAFLQYTSGSTAAPRGVVLRHGQLLANLELIRERFGHGPQSRGVIWLPPYHDMGLIGGILQPLYVGFPVTLMSPQDFLQRPLRWLEAVSRVGATTSGGPNFAFDLCVRKSTPEERASLDLSRWEVAFVGGEPVRAATLRRFAEAFGPAGFREDAFYPCYGLAEATLFVSGGPPGQGALVRRFSRQELAAHRVVDLGDIGVAQDVVGCGEVPPGVELKVVDPETWRPRGPGEVGELWVRGPSVAEGYWGRPDESRERFNARLAGSDEAGFLRTGDLGLFWHGQLFVTGRMKDLLILRGRNVYPQDLEHTAEEAHPALRRGGAAAFSVEVFGEERLVMVLEVERQHEDKLHEDKLYEAGGAIRRVLAAQHDVSPYAVILVRSGSVPKTSSGKVQRHQCREAFLSGALEALGRWYEGQGPRTETERTLAGLWAEVLGGPELGPKGSFLERGGDSLAVARLVARMRELLGVEVPFRTVFSAPTLGALAEEVDRLKADRARPQVARLEAVPRGGPLPASFEQKHLWNLGRRQPGSPAYHESVGLRLTGKVDAAALERSLGEVVRRHEVLRTRFEAAGEEPSQHVEEGARVPLERYDVTGLPVAEREAEVAAKVRAEVQRPFELTRPGLVRAVLFQLGEGESLLLLVAHRIVADGGSMGVLLRELTSLYAAYLRGQPSPLPALPVQYADFAAWQRGWLTAERVEPQLAYWREQLKDSPPTKLPAARPRPSSPSTRGGQRQFIVPPAVAEALRALAADEGATLYMVGLAAFQTLLHRYTGQDDIVVGSPTASRPRPEAEGLIGCFANTLVMRTRLDGEPTFRELLGRVREVTLGALDHQDVPIEDASLQALFVLQYAPLLQAELPGMKLSVEPVDGGVAQADLALQLWVRPEGLTAVLVYSEDVFEEAPVARMAETLESLLMAIAENPDRRVSQLPLPR